MFDFSYMNPLIIWEMWEEYSGLGKKQMRLTTESVQSRYFAQSKLRCTLRNPSEQVL